MGRHRYTLPTLRLGATGGAGAGSGRAIGTRVPQWENEIESRRSAARRADADRDAQTASRLAFLTGAQRQNEADRAEAERAVAVALSHGIENPTVRLDAAGAVRLADWNPFTDADE